MKLYNTQFFIPVLLHLRLNIFPSSQFSEEFRKIAETQCRTTFGLLVRAICHCYINSTITLYSRDGDPKPPISKSSTRNDPQVVSGPKWSACLLVLSSCTIFSTCCHLSFVCMQCPPPYRRNIQVECFTVVMINHKIKELQKTAIFGTAHKVRTLLM